MCKYTLNSTKLHFLSCSYPFIFANFVSLRVSKLKENSGEEGKKRRPATHTYGVNDKMARNTDMITETIQTQTLKENGDE